MAAPAYLTPSTASSFDVLLSGGAASPSASVTVDGGNAANKAFASACGFRDANGHAVSGMVLNGVSMSALGIQLSGNGAAQRTYGLATGSGNMGSVTLAVNTTGGVGTQDAVLSFMAFSDVDQTTPFDNYASNSASSGSPGTLSVTSAVGDTPFWFITSRAFAGDTVNPTNYTERVDNLNGSGGSTVVMGGGEGTGAATVNFSGAFSGGASNGWAAQGANLNAVAGGGGVTGAPWHHYAQMRAAA